MDASSEELWQNDREFLDAIQSLNAICPICGQGDRDRPLLEFGPDLSLHLFCGKTAHILHQRPELEVLSKAGLKNKFGKGPDVNLALRSTRSVVFDSKTFYLVREFEANLEAARAGLLLHY